MGFFLLVRSQAHSVDRILRKLSQDHACVVVERVAGEKIKNACLIQSELKLVLKETIRLNVTLINSSPWKLMLRRKFSMRFDCPVVTLLDLFFDVV